MDRQTYLNDKNFPLQLTFKAFQTMVTSVHITSTLHTESKLIHIASVHAEWILITIFFSFYRQSAFKVSLGITFASLSRYNV